jgi:hypothetical protein
MPLTIPVAPKLAAAFVSDAENAAIILEDLLPKLNSGKAADLELYTTTVHGMKSSLTNVGEAMLSAFARKLENAGSIGELSVITAETPVFIQRLKTSADKFRLPDSDAGSS